MTQLSTRWFSELLHFYLNTIIFIWVGKEGINFTQLLSILSQILPIAKVIFSTFEHINHILGVKINIYQFIQIFVNILYHELCKNVLFPMVLILSINQGDKTEKNIKTSPSLLPPHNHCEKQGIWSAKYPALISHDKANKTQRGDLLGFGQMIIVLHRSGPSR